MSFNIVYVFWPFSSPLGDDALLERMVSTWGAMFGSSALHTQTTALGEGIKQCTVGRTTMVTITTRDWQVSLVFVFTVSFLLLHSYSLSIQ